MRRMSPSDARCGPWLAVMIRTSWPRSRRFSYRYRTCCATPPVLRVDVRADEADLHRALALAGVGPPARVVARRPEVAAGIAVVAAGPVAPDPTGDLGAGVAAALAELLPERPELAGRGVEVPPWSVVRVSMARRRLAASSPGNVVQPLAIASSACASLLPTRARPCWSANRTTRWCHGLPRLVGLNVSRPSGWAAGSGSSRRRRSIQPWAHRGRARAGGPGSRDHPPRGSRGSWCAACDTGGSAGRRQSASKWPPRVVTSSPTTTSTRRPRSRAIACAATAASIRSWSRWR